MIPKKEYENAIFKTRFWLFSVFTSVSSFHDEVRGYMFATLAFGLWDQRIKYNFFFLRTAPARVDALQQSLSGKRQVGSEKLETMDNCHPEQTQFGQNARVKRTRRKGKRVA